MGKASEFINLLTSILALGVIVLPIVKKMLVKLNNIPDKTRIRQMVWSVVLMATIGISFVFHLTGQRVWSAIFACIFALFSIASFLQNPHPPSRREIVFEVVNPVVIFLMLYSWL